MKDDIRATTQTGHAPEHVETDGSVSIDAVFDVLSDHRRRYALYILFEQETPMQVPALAERMAPWVHDTDPEHVTEQQIERTHVSLRHGHLPKLDEVGAIEYDRRAAVVSLARTEPFEDYLEFAANEER